MADNETIADIIAEMRGLGNYQQYSGDHARQLADRLEAALKREKAAIEADALAVGGIVGASHMREMSKNASKNGADFGQLGDAAKLREALRECAQYIACVGGIGVGEVTINDNVHLIPEELTQKAIAALAAPPRNCDRFATVDEARKAHEEYRGDYIMRASNKFDFPMKFEAWLFAPATEKEGGAK